MSLHRAIFLGLRQVYRQRAPHDAAVEHAICDVTRMTSGKCRAQRFLASRNVENERCSARFEADCVRRVPSGTWRGSPSANRIVRFPRCAPSAHDLRNIPSKSSEQSAEQSKFCTNKNVILLCSLALLVTFVSCLCLGTCEQSASC